MKTHNAMAAVQVDDEYWGPIYGPGGPRIRLAAQVANYVKALELTDTAVPGSASSAVSTFIDDCGSTGTPPRPKGWKGPWPPRPSGLDPLDLVTIGWSLLALVAELADGELAKVTRDGGLRLLQQGMDRLG